MLYSRDSGLEASFTVEGEPRELPADTELACRRIAQEALTNARKHAPGAAGHGAASPTTRPKCGCSSEPPAAPGPSRMSNDGGGYGIAGMRERAELLHGRLYAPARSSGGWEVELCIPA